MEAVGDSVISARAKGDKIAVKGEDVLSYWVCKKEFPADVYVPGLDDPSCYPDNFELSENASGFDDAAEPGEVVVLLQWFVVWFV